MSPVFHRYAEQHAPDHAGDLTGRACTSERVLSEYQRRYERRIGRVHEHPVVVEQGVLMNADKMMKLKVMGMLRRYLARVRHRGADRR